MVRPAFVVAAVVAVVTAASAHAASSLPSRIGMYPKSGAPLAMLDSDITVRVRGPIAEAIVTQTFRNDTDRVTEATYIFPLPADAAVSAMEIETGTRVIHASIERRDQAQQRYERAVAAGIGAGLLDQERPDVFTQTVSAIPARGTVTVTLRFDTVARYANGQWELVVPLVVAPRYVPGTASGRPTTGAGRAPDTDRAPDASRVTPGGAPGAGGATTIVLELDNADDVTSPTHELAKASSGYRLTDPKSDHDAVIRWRAKAPSAGWVEAADDGGGFAAVVVSAPPAATRTAALRMTVLVDHVATTRGDADAVRRPLVRALLSALGGKDRIAIAGGLELAAQAPDRIARDLDGAWSKSRPLVDLTKVLTGARGDGALLLVSDGLVADDRAVLAAAAKVRAPIHVIGIGPAPNRSLLAAIAKQTGGTVRFVTVGDDLAELARDVLADLAAPPERLAINWGTLAASDVVPSTLPRLGAGQALLVLARVKRVQQANARVRGDVFGFVTVTPARPPDGATTSRGTLARRWAKLKLDELVAAGDARMAADHALRHGLVSPYTSMVAIGTEVVIKGGVKHSVPVPVSVPEGMQWQLVKQQTTVETATTVTKVPEVVVDQKTEPKPTPKSEPKRDQDRETYGAGAVEEESRAADMPEPSGAAPRAPVATGADTSDSLEEDEGSEQSAEIVTASGLADGRRGRFRFGLAFGGGVSVVGGETAPLGALSARAELARRLFAGLEGSLWLVDGFHGQGSVFGLFGYRGLGGGFARRLELAIGAGFTVTGEAAGPAANLTLRARLPVRPLGAYLRYDGALLLHDQTFDGQNAASFGLEARF